MRYDLEQSGEDWADVLNEIHEEVVEASVGRGTAGVSASLEAIRGWDE